MIADHDGIVPATADSSNRRYRRLRRKVVAMATIFQISLALLEVTDSGGGGRVSFWCSCPTSHETSRWRDGPKTETAMRPSMTPLRSRSPHTRSSDTAASRDALRRRLQTGSLAVENTASVLSDDLGPIYLERS